MLKVKPPDEYPPEEGRYLRGNDYSPVAVCAILNTFDFKIPQRITDIVRGSIEAGAALAGTLQTENIGIEKIVANVVANPNIRYIVLCAVESPGHLCGEALIALLEHGVDEQKKIIGTEALTPFLYNLPIESIERFRKQVKLINLLNEGNPDEIKAAVRACYQEEPTEFRGYLLSDPGAYPEPPIVQPLTWRITEPWKVVTKEEERRLTEIREKAAAAGKAAQQRTKKGTY
ncbi:MAG: tetrahydromethanopterin S-methyltransferase subunit A [Candidatus Methanospirareceae archaeon]